MQDITIKHGQKGEFAFVPHSQKADDFLFHQFGIIGERDLTMQDAELISRRAKSRGFVVKEVR